MVDPQSCSSNNRASMDGTGDEKEEEAEWQIYNLVLAAIKLVWMVLVMRKKKRRNRLIGPFSPNYKMFCCHGEPQTLSHQKSDAIFLLTRLKGRNIFGLCLIRLNCVILDLDGILGFQGGLGFLVLILGHPTPKALTIILVRSLRRSIEMENLGFLKNSRIYKIRKNDSPRSLYRR